jgi:hypothetical protein
MARITVNTTGFQPHIYLTTDTDTGNLYAGTGSTTWVTTTDALDVTCLQDITVNNSTGIFSWVDFCSTDMNKITTPADNSISTNIVIDATDFFGDPLATDPSAEFSGVNGLASTKTYVQWVLVMNGDLDAATIARAGTAGEEGRWYRGVGYITSISPTVSPDSPVWVSPMEIAVSGDMTTGIVTS